MFGLIKNNKIFNVLDIGNAKVACLSFKIENGKPKIIGMDHQKSEGLKEFKLYDKNKLSRVIEKTLKNSLGKNINSNNCIFFSNITDINSMQRKTLCRIKSGNLGITKKDIRKLFKKSLLESQIKGKQIIHSFPLNFILDEQKVTDNPVGEKCKELGISSLNLMVDNSLIENLKNCFGEININISNFFDSGIASAFSTLNEREKNEGVASIDIGASTSKVVVINNNKIIYSNVIPLGGRNVTNDLFKGLEIPKESAETTKILNGTLSPNFNNKIEISINSKNKKLVNKNIIFGIIKPRYEEILEIIRDNIFDNIYTRVSIKSIVITGGAGKIYGLDELSENIFNRKTRIATKNMKDSYFENKPEFSTILGMVKLAKDYEKFEFSNKILSSKVHNAIDKLDNWIEESYA